MDFMDNLLDKTQRAGKYAYDKAVEVKDTVKLEFNASTLRNRIADQYKELGRLTYLRKKGDTSLDDVIDQVIVKIDENKQELAEVKAKIEASKKSE
jgi:hypothetical protein